jgi:hypothetical protein
MSSFLFAQEVMSLHGREKVTRYLGLPTKFLFFQWTLVTNFFEQHQSHSVTGVDLVMSASGVLWAVFCCSDNSVSLWKREAPANGTKNQFASEGGIFKN